MSSVNKENIVDKLVQIWWVRLPLAARKLSANLMVSLVDGFYLVAWPKVAAFAPPVVLLAGVLIGWQHWGFEAVYPDLYLKAEVFTQSITVMAIAAVIGISSGQLGVLFLIGFIFGDFFLVSRDWSYPYETWQHMLRLRMPMLIEYGLLGLLTVNLPIWTKALMAQLSLSPSLSRKLRFVVALFGHAILTFVLVYLWVQMAPIVIRPIFTWLESGGQSIKLPPIEAVEPLQKRGMIVVYFAVLASLIRMVLQGLTAFRPESGKRLDKLQQQLTTAPPVLPLFDRLYPWVRVTMRALWATLMLAGLITIWQEGVALCALILALQAARSNLIYIPIDWWRVRIERLPLIFRLASGMIIVYFLSTSILILTVPRDQINQANALHKWLFNQSYQLYQFSQTNTFLKWLFNQIYQINQANNNLTFRSILFCTGVALIILFLLNPGLPSTKQKEREQPA